MGSQAKVNDWVKPLNSVPKSRAGTELMRRTNDLCLGIKDNQRQTLQLNLR